MGPDLKKLLWSWSFAMTGIIGMIVVVVIYPISNSHRSVGYTGWVWFICLVVNMVLSTFGFVSATRYDEKEAKLAWRWFLLDLGEFPRNAVERNSQRQRAYDVLKPRAIQASQLFVERDSEYSEKIAAEASAFPPTKTGKELREVRERHGRDIADLRRKYQQLSDDANLVYRHYIKLWKLFEDLDMIPIDPDNKRPFRDPETFRRRVMGFATKAGPEHAAHFTGGTRI